MSLVQSFKTKKNSETVVDPFLKKLRYFSESIENLYNFTSL